MRRRTKRFGVAVAAALGVCAVGGFVDGLLPEAGAAITDPVSYEVGDVLVFGAAHRNGSCSVTRNIVNRGPVPLRVVGTISWPEHLDPLWPNSGSFDGDEVLAPGEQVTAVWTNHDYLPSDHEVQLAWSVYIADGAAQIGANRLELIEQCRAVDVPSPDTTVPTTAPSTSAPPVTDPPPVSVTQPVPDTTVPPPDTTVVSGPAPTTTVAETGVCVFDPVVNRGRDTATGQFCAGVEVETQVARRAELPHTGADTWQLVALGVGLVVTGASIVARPGRKLTHGEDAS